MFTETIGNLSVAVIAFYLIVFCNFTAETLGCNLQYILRTNMLAKHIISIILMLFLVVFINPKDADKNILAKIGMAIGIYFWFIITTRCPLPIMIIVLIFLLATYIANSTKTRYENDLQKQKKVENLQYGFAIAAFAFSIIGFIIYLFEKYVEYGDDFSFMKFFTGNAVCRNYTPSYLKIIK